MFSLMGVYIMLVYPFNSWTQFGNGALGLPDGFQDDYEEIKCFWENMSWIYLVSTRMV